MKKIKQFLKWNSRKVLKYKEVNPLELSDNIINHKLLGLLLVLIHNICFLVIIIIGILIIPIIIISSLIDIIYYFVDEYEKHNEEKLRSKQELIRFSEVKDIIESKNEEYDKLKGMLQIVKRYSSNKIEIVPRISFMDFGIKDNIISLFNNYLMNYYSYTIIKGDDINNKQCHNAARRSILDVWSIIKCYYPEANFNEFLKAIVELINENKLFTSKCNDINKYVLYTEKLSNFNDFKKSLEIYDDKINFEDLIIYYKHKKDE